MKKFLPQTYFMVYFRRCFFTLILWHLPLSRCTTLQILDLSDLFTILQLRSLIVWNLNIFALPSIVLVYLWLGTCRGEQNLGNREVQRMLNFSAFVRHCPRLGLDYFVFQNYCAVFASFDNCVLLALAAGQSDSVGAWHKLILSKHFFMAF